MMLAIEERELNKMAALGKQEDRMQEVLQDREEDLKMTKMKVKNLEDQMKSQEKIWMQEKGDLMKSLEVGIGFCENLNFDFKIFYSLIFFKGSEDEDAETDERFRVKFGRKSFNEDIRTRQRN